MVSVSSSCLVCGEVAGRVNVPGGLLRDDGRVVGFHLPPLGEPSVYAGHLLVSPRRHASGFADLTRDEASAVGIAMSCLSAALSSVGATRVYTATIGHNIDHLHVHLIARWPETPLDVPWHSIDDWPGARRITDAEISEFVEQLRSATITWT
jgi:diadenosine tetraphosphate (Ap4A) HIT family hydrolase